MRLLWPALRDTDMNNFGVLRALAYVLSDYSNNMDADGLPIINITLTK